MTYVRPNFKTKKDLKRALADGHAVYAWEPGTLAPDPANRTVYLEGPWYPEPHRWWGQAKTDADGRIVSVK